MQQASLKHLCHHSEGSNQLTHHVIVALFLADDHALFIAGHILAGRRMPLVKQTAPVLLTK